MAGQIQLVVDGMTASGKSTLVELLASELHLKIMPELFNDPFELLKRYAYDAKWCLPMQLNFLVTRYSQYLVASEANEYILDRSIFSDKVYADMYYEMKHLDRQQYETYVQLHDSLIERLPAPQCMIFLTCSFEEVMRRIVRRGREFEIHQGEGYWRMLFAAYERHIARVMEQNPQGHYLLINSQEANYASDPSDRARLVAKVKAALDSGRAVTA